MQLTYQKELAGLMPKQMMKFVLKFVQTKVFILTLLMTILLVHKVSRPGTSGSETVGGAVSFFPIYNQECSKFNGSVDNPFFLNYTSDLREVSYHTTSPDSIIQGTYHFAVNSQPKAYLARRAIRDTWKNVLVAYTRSGERNCSGSLRFYIGQSSNEGTAAKLRKEMRQYDDIVLLQFCDKYENLALKTFHIMCYVNQRVQEQHEGARLKFVVKIDDDVLPDLSAFFTCFPRLQNSSYGIYGWVTADYASVEKWDKYRISTKRWNHTRFPAFTHGPAYAIRTSDLPKLIQEAKKTPVINLEDVWFTGIVAEKAGVKRMGIERFVQFGESSIQLKKATNSSLFAGFFHHSFGSKMLRVLWQNMDKCCGCFKSCGLFRKFIIQD